MTDHGPRVIAAIPDIVMNAIDAANTHDVDAFAGCFHSVGVIDAWGMLFEGDTSIREWTQRWVVEYRVRFTDLLHLWEGPALAVHTQVHGLGYNGPATLAFSLSDARIDTLGIT